MHSYVTCCIQIPCCGLSGRWTTGWTGARESLASTALAPNWKVWMVRNFLAWTERLSKAWYLTALHKRSFGNTWRTWEEVIIPKKILPAIRVKASLAIARILIYHKYLYILNWQMAFSLKHGFPLALLIWKLPMTVSWIFLSMDLFWQPQSSQDKVRSDLKWSEGHWWGKIPKCSRLIPQVTTEFEHMLLLVSRTTQCQGSPILFWMVSVNTEALIILSYVTLHVVWAPLSSSLSPSLVGFWRPLWHCSHLSFLLSLRCFF